jgi:hypothetical protein
MANERPQSGGLLRSRAGFVLIAFLVIAAFFLWEEHKAHLLGALPFAILALCPLLHLFMHRGHGGHSAGDERHKDHN